MAWLPVWLKTILAAKTTQFQKQESSSCNFSSSVSKWIRYSSYRSMRFIVNVWFYEYIKYLINEDFVLIPNSWSNIVSDDLSPLNRIKCKM